MSSTLYLSAATANHAAQTMQDHAKDEDGWCGFCLRHHHIRVRAGDCTPFQRAAGFLTAFNRQQRRLPRVSFSRPPSRD
jgi:hypothetical protein